MYQHTHSTTVAPEEPTNISNIIDKPFNSMSTVALISVMAEMRAMGLTNNSTGALAQSTLKVTKLYFEIMTTKEAETKVTTTVSQNKSKVDYWRRM